MTDATLLNEMGTREFLRIKYSRGTGALDEEGWMIGWFANAIEAGRTAGRKEVCPHDWFLLADDLEICRDCGTRRSDDV